MSPNQYVSDLRAEVAALRAVVARVAALHSVLDEGYCYEDGARNPCPTLRLTLGVARGSTDSDPAATERQGEAGGAGDGV